MNKIKVTSTVLFLSSAILMTACQQKNNENQKPVVVDVQGTTTEETTETVNQKIEINYNQMQLFRGVNDLYQFKAPAGLFKLAGNDVYISNQLDASISVFTNYTDRFDQSGFYKFDDLIDKYKQGRTISYSVKKNNWFVLSGFDQQNNLFYLKGFYDEMISMQGREEGEPSWLWSKSGVIFITYPEKFRKEFDGLVPAITKSFTCDFSNF